MGLKKERKKFDGLLVLRKRSKSKRLKRAERSYNFTVLLRTSKEVNRVGGMHWPGGE